jgi:predicted component of type VI protein secretion system
MRQAVRLRDGDQIRLGSLVFYFFICSGSQMADPVSAEWLEQTNAVRKQVTAAAEPDLPLMPPKSDKADSSSTADTSMFRLDQSSPLV